MPRSQTRLEFPVQKGPSTRTRGKARSIQDENVPLSPTKRPGRQTDPAAGCSPSKKQRNRRSRKVDSENVKPASHVETAPIAVPSPHRLPLTPRKDVPSSTMNPQRLLLSPQKAISSLILSPQKVPLSPMKDYPAVILSPKRLPPSPRKDAHIIQFYSPSKASPLASQGAARMHSASKASTRLRFDSPVRNDGCRTPERFSVIPTKGRALEFGSPKKLSEARCSSPRKSLGTPRPIRVKPITSPMRLAKQEGVCYQRAKQALHTAPPDQLLCREKEMQQVDSFLDSHLHKGVPGSLYVSGAPGTGKTAMLSRTMARLQEEDSQVIYINCMSMRNSQAIYNKILGELKGKDVSMTSKQATQQLEKALTCKGNIVTLILDEMDQLDSKNQEILYTVFEWPTLAKSRLVLIGIANALDLTDRILPRLQARPKCKPQLLNFPPYTREQISTILTQRLKQVEVNGEQVLDPSAIQFCARKVSAVAGDMRKALDVCRRAVEMVEAEVKKQHVLTPAGSPRKAPPVPKKIGVAHILKIINEVYGSRVSTSRSGPQQTIPLQQKLAVCALLLLNKNVKVKEVTVGKLHETYCKICHKQNVTSIDQSEFLSTCSLIEAHGIMLLKPAKDARMTKVSLKLDEKELEGALQDRTLLASILQVGL